MRVDKRHASELLGLGHHSWFKYGSKSFNVDFLIELAWCGLLRAARTRHVSFSLCRGYKTKNRRQQMLRRKTVFLKNSDHLSLRFSARMPKRRIVAACTDALLSPLVMNTRNLNLSRSEGFGNS